VFVHVIFGRKKPSVRCRCQRQGQRTSAVFVHVILGRKKPSVHCRCQRQGQRTTVCLCMLFSVVRSLPCVVGANLRGNAPPCVRRRGAGLRLERCNIPQHSFGAHQVGTTWTEGELPFTRVHRLCVCIQLCECIVYV
jgi:hypothetical protein